MRVTTIDHLSMTAQEMSRLWADQDKYIDLLESRLEKGSQREQRMMSELVKKKQKLYEMTAKWEKLKASRVSELGLSDSECRWVCNNCKMDFLSTMAILALIWTSFPGLFLVLISFNVSLMIK